MNDDYLIDCIENEIESGYFDFKKDIYDFTIQKCKEDFLTDIISFANSHSKGNKYIITGVKLHEDNSRDLIGITQDKIQDGADYQSLVNDNIEPNIIVDFKVLEYKNKKFGIFNINNKNIDTPYLLSKKYGKLEKGFIKIRKGQKNEYVTRRDFDIFYKEKIDSEVSNIHLYGVIDKKINSKFELKKITNDIKFELLKAEIEKLFDDVLKINLEKSLGSGFGLALGSKLSVSEEDISNIKLYANHNEIKLPKDFFDVGNLKYSQLLPYGSANIYGTESEEQKYNLLCELSKLTAIYEGLKSFNDNIGNLYYSELAISNDGKKFDENIEVTLIVDKDVFLDYRNFPIPTEAIIEDLLDKDILDKYLINEKVNGINTYEGENMYSLPIRPTGVQLPSLLGYSNPSYESYMEYYYDYINAIATYEILSDNQYYYIKYEQKKIKPNEKIFLPSRLFFKEKPNCINYEIKSKYNANIQKGEIFIKEDS